VERQKGMGKLKNGDKNNFVLYTSFYEPIRKLTNRDKGLLLDAIFLFHKDEEIPKLSAAAAIAFEFMKNQFSLDSVKYEKRCRKNQENIAKRWENQAQKNTNGYERIPNDTNEYKGLPNDNDNDKDIYIEKLTKEKNGGNEIEITESLKNLMIPENIKELFRQWLKMRIAVHGKLPAISQDCQLGTLLKIPARQRKEALTAAIAGTWKNINPISETKPGTKKTEKEFRSTDGSN
jgi:hypothetical protein